jgi:hypothetical protein
MKNDDNEVLGFGVFPAMVMKTIMFWLLTPYRSDEAWHSGRTYGLQLLDRRISQEGTR